MCPLVPTSCLWLRVLGAWPGLQGHALPSAALAPRQAPHGCWALAFRGPVENRLTQFDSPVCQLHPYKVPVLLYLCMPRSNRFGDLMWDVVPRGDSPQGPRWACQWVGSDGVRDKLGSGRKPYAPSRVQALAWDPWHFRQRILPTPGKGGGSGVERCNQSRCQTLYHLGISKKGRPPDFSPDGASWAFRDEEGRSQE